MATKPFLSQIAVPVGTTTGDVYYPQTSLLMHFNGTNGSTTMTDNSKNNATVTATNGAAISTAQSKFGGTSLLLDGTDDYLQVPYSTINNLGTGENWTVELWINMPSIPAAAMDVIGASNGGGAVPKWHLAVNMNTSFTYSANKVGFYTYVAGADRWINVNYTWSAGVWYNITAVYDSVNTTLYVNGVSVGSLAYNAGSSTNGIRIGSDGEGYKYLAGYIDEVRITKGIARYTGNFTPSTTQFLDSTGDANSNVVVNSTATGFAIGTGGINGAQLAKAWVNFDGIGTVSIRDSYSVSSITDLGTGTYDVNFSSTFSTIPTVVASTSNQVVNTNYGVNVNSHTTSKVQIFCTENGVTTDKGVVSVIVFRN